VKPAAKICVIAGGVLCLAALPLAYQQRHFLHQVVHRLALHRRPRLRSGPPVIHSLEFDGRQFPDVLGYPPYYLEVPQLGSVLFVTRLTSGGSNVIHLLNRKSGQDVQIHTIADFGRSIGLTNGAFQEYVESVDPGRISVSSECGAGVVMKTIYHLNLQTQTMDSRDIYYYDTHGNMTNSRHAPGF
jgi:hypothetical protein